MPEESFHAFSKVKSYAKINTFLRVVGKAQNGYHLLQTGIIFVSLHDVLSVTASDKTFSTHQKLESKFEECGTDGVALLDFEKVKISFRCKDKYLARNFSSNTIIKALKALPQGLVSQKIQDLGLENLYLSIFLQKNIPYGSGLGGASSNAAEFLLILNSLLNLGLSKEELIKIGACVGADVPIFLGGKSSFCEGIGDVLTTMEEFSSSKVLLIYPGSACLTADVFKHFAENNIDGKAFLPNITLSNMGRLHFSSNSEESSWRPYSQNYLTDSAIAVCPPIKDVLEFLGEQSGACTVEMSGSGSACFAAFKSENCLNKAHESAVKIAAQKNWSVFVEDIMYKIR